MYVLNIFRQRAARGHWADRWGSEWNRQTKWASQWRNSQSWTKVQQATATLLLEAIRPYSKNTKLLGDSCILSCDNCWKCRPRVWKTLANNDFFYSVISDLKMFCIEFCFPYTVRYKWCWYKLEWLSVYRLVNTQITSLVRFIVLISDELICGEKIWPILVFYLNMLIVCKPSSNICTIKWRRWGSPTVSHKGWSPGVWRYKIWLQNKLCKYSKTCRKHIS